MGFTARGQVYIWISYMNHMQKVEEKHRRRMWRDVVELVRKDIKNIEPRGVNPESAALESLVRDECLKRGWKPGRLRGDRFRAELVLDVVSELQADRR